jgi:hypothetical protein
MVTSKSYTVAWDERKYVADDFSDQMDAGNREYIVWDVCSKPVDRKNWQVAEKVRYFGHFYNSLRDFATTDHEVFIWSAGDILCDDFVAFVSKVEGLFAIDPDIWLMSPHLPTDGGSGVCTAIDESTMYDDMFLTLNINGLYVVLRRSLVLVILEYFEWLLRNGHMNFKKMISGHCLDWVYSAWVIYNKKKTYRDMTSEMFEVDGTSYETNTALWECNNIRDRFVEYIDFVGGSGATVKKIFDAIHDNEDNHCHELLGIKKAYPNMSMSERQEFTY